VPLGRHGWAQRHPANAGPRAPPPPHHNVRLPATGYREDFCNAFSALSNAAANPFAHSWFTRDRSAELG
jgi:hypothetical protein